MQLMDIDGSGSGRVAIWRCIWVLILAATGALGARACLAQEPVRVALNAPLSGAFANIGDLYLKHSLLAIEAINARGGVLGGRRLELVPTDNKNSPQEALLRLQETTDRGIGFVVQGAGSHIAVPLAEAAERHNARQSDRRVLFLNQSGDWELSNEKCSFWTFLFYANAQMKMEALTDFMAHQPAIKRVYLIAQDYAFGHQVRGFAKDMLARKRPDIAIVGDDLHPLGKVKDFSPYVAKMKAASADAVITANWGNDLALLIKAAGEAGLGATFYTYYGSGPGAPTAMGRAAADKVKAIYRWHPNLPNDNEWPQAEEYKRRFGSDYYGLPIGNLFEMLAAAIDRAGSTDALAVARALEGMRHRTSTGEAWLRPDDHQLFEPMLIYTLTAVNGRDVLHDLEGTGLGTRTDVRVEAGDIVLPTRCRMQRPAAVAGGSR
jgi:branched-chain amino acid transport system substrate-binding protein